MASPLKRKLGSATRSLSPPPLRRRLSPSKFIKQQAAADTDTSTVEPATNAPTKSITLYSWNVNSIGPLLQKQLTFSSNSTYPIRTFLKIHRWPHFLCLQEVKVNRDDHTTQRRIELAANAGGQSDEPTYTVHFSLPRDRYNATGFGGKVHGVATLVRDDPSLGDIVTSRPDWDLEGRVLIHSLPSHSLVVINGYWVNGTSNPYRNPNTGSVEGTRHDHKLRFHANMLKLCKDIESAGKDLVPTRKDDKARANEHTKGKHILLLGDMNIARSRIDGHPNLRTSPVQHVYNRADFNAKFFTDADGLCGVDVFRHVHGEVKKYTYHGRGRPWGESCDRVDSIIANQALVDAGAVIATDICDNPADRGHSDHVPLWVEVDVAKLGTVGAEVGHATTR